MYQVFIVLIPCYFSDDVTIASIKSVRGGCGLLVMSEAAAVFLFQGNMTPLNRLTDIERSFAQAGLDFSTDNDLSQVFAVHNPTIKRIEFVL